MKNSKLNLILPAIILSLLLSSCSAIAGIFNAGVSVGIFLVVIVIIIIGVIIFSATRKK